MGRDHHPADAPIAQIPTIAKTKRRPVPQYSFPHSDIAMLSLISVLTVATYADDIRAARLRQHGLPVPKDPDLGRPTH